MIERKEIEKLKAENEEQKEKIARLENKLRSLEMNLNEVLDDVADGGRMARAICELQEYLSDKDSSFFCVNKINAPTRVGMN